MTVSVQPQQLRRIWEPARYLCVQDKYERGFRRDDILRTRNNRYSNREVTQRGPLMKEREKTTGGPLIGLPWGRNASGILMAVNECATVFADLPEDKRVPVNRVLEEIALIAGTALGLGDEHISQSEEAKVDDLRLQLKRIVGIQ